MEEVRGEKKGAEDQEEVICLKDSGNDGIQDVRRRRQRQMCIGDSMLYALTWQSTNGFLPTFLQAEKGFSVALASTGFAVLFAVGMTVKPISGALGDRIGRTTVAVGSLLLGLLGLVGLLLAEHTALIFGGIVVFSAGLMSFPPVMQAYLMDLFPDESMGGDLGGMRTLYIGVGSLGPTYVGYVGGAANYTVAFAGLTACLLGGASIVAAYELRYRDR